MVGKIRTKDRCKKCGEKFSRTPIGFICAKDLTKPDHYFIEIHWKGTQYKIYHDIHGDRLDSWDRVSDLYITINKALKEHTFDPSHFVRRETREFWVSTLLGKFLDDKLPDIKPSYKKDYRRMVHVASDHFGEKDFRDLQKIHLKEYKLKLEERGLSPKSVKNYLDHFKTFILWCQDMKGIKTQITGFLKLPKYKPAPHWVDSEGQINLYSLVDEKDKAIIGFLMLHGCRPGEARAIKIRDVSLKYEKITISRTWSLNKLCDVRKGPDGSAEAYDVPIHPEMLGWITERVKNAFPEDFLFLNPNTRKHYTESALKKVWDQVRKKAGLGLELRLYDVTRHSFATNLSNYGTDLRKLKDLMGHADIRTTNKYTHSSVEYLRPELLKLTLKKPAKVVQLKPDQTRPAMQKL